MNEYDQSNSQIVADLELCQLSEIKVNTLLKAFLKYAVYIGAASALDQIAEQTIPRYFQENPRVKRQTVLLVITISLHLFIT